VNYRGAEAEQPVDIGISLRSFTAVYAAGKDELDGDGVIDMTWGRRATDNDVGPWDLLKDEKWFAKKLTVEALYNTIRNGTEGEPMSLTPVAPLKVSDLATAKLGANGSSNNKKDNTDVAYLFTMDYGPIGSFSNPGGSPNTSAESWVFDPYDWGISGNTKNNGAAKPVTVYYANPDSPDETKTGTIKTKALKSDPLPVTWTGIGKIDPNKISGLGE